MKLRILLVMDPFIPVPPEHYGGIERVIADLANGLHAKGHSITLWAGPGSRVAGAVRGYGKVGEWTTWSNIRNTVQLGFRFRAERREFDVIHNFGRLVYLLPILRDEIPKVQTYMRTVNPANMRRAASLGARKLHFTAVSRAICETGRVGGGEWSVIYNCAPIDRYRFRDDVDSMTAPLVFLGRIERCKGVHTAIAVARRLKRHLVIAGNISALAHEREYYESEIKPNVDGELVTYIGPVNDSEKDRLLGSAAALLTPVEWEEPFPIVLPEALACGTPVISFRRGGMPEGIRDGDTGFVCEDVEEMIEAVGRLNEIDRRACRDEAERRFSANVIIGEYERLYLKLL